MFSCELWQLIIYSNLQIKSVFGAKMFALGVVIKIPVPKQTAKTNFQVTSGKAKYNPSIDSLVWKWVFFSFFVFPRSSFQFMFPVDYCSASWLVYLFTLFVNVLLCWIPLCFLVSPFEDPICHGSDLGSWDLINCWKWYFSQYTMHIINVLFTVNWVLFMM